MPQEILKKNSFIFDKIKIRKTVAPNLNLNGPRHDDMSAAVYSYLSNVQIAIIGETEPDVTKVGYKKY